MNNPFPWRYFLRSARARVLLVLSAFFLIYTVYAISPQNFLSTAFIILFVLVFLALVQSYFRAIPMRDILARIESIQSKLSHDQSLDWTYLNDEFALIEEALDLAERQLKVQRESFENQRIQSETILDYIPDPVVVVDKFQNCLRNNRQFSNRFMQGKEFGSERRKIWQIFSDEALLDAFTQAISQKKTVLLPGARFPQFNEYFDIAVAPIMDAHGNITGALGAFHNVTKAKLSEKMRVDFVANVSHEIRTPLTSVKGYSQLLLAEKEKVPAELRSALDKINDNAERLKELFDNLLKLSVIGSTNELEKKPFKLRELVDAIVSRLRGKYLNLDFQVEMDGDLEIWGDQKLLDQVFANLLDNAIKYSDKQPARIAIIPREEEDQALISISDNGPGIPDQEAERIFERFYRAQGLFSKPIEGAGLGLSIVKHVLDKHGGSIKADTSGDQGSTFTICLPKMPKC